MVSLEVERLQRRFDFLSRSGKLCYRAIRGPLVYLTIISMILTLSCGGGGGGTADTGGVPTSTVDPGQFITITSSSIKAGETATVTFRGANNYEATLRVTETTDGSLRVAVPAFVNLQTTSLTQGTLNVMVNGQDAGVSLAVRNLPELGSIQPGQVVSMLLAAIRGQLVTARSRLALQQVNSGTDVSAALNSIQTRIDSLTAMMNEISTQHTLTVARDGGIIVLQEADLKVLDRWIYATFSGIANEMLDRSLPAASTSLRAIRSSPINPQESIDAVISGLQGGINWSNVFWGGVGAVVATGGVILGGPAALIAVPIGLGIAITSACWDMGASAAFNRVLEGLETGSGEAYDLGEKLWDHAVEIGLAGWSATEHWTAEMYDDISQWVSSIDLADKLVEIKCRLAPPEAASKRNGGTLPRLDAPAIDLCTAFDHSVPPAEGRVIAMVSIPDAGYYTLFTGKNVYAWLFHVQNVYEDQYYPQIVAKSNPIGYVNPNGGMPLEDTITIAFAPNLSCSQDYALEGSIEDGVTVSFSTNRFTPDPKFGSYMTVNGKLSLIRFGSGVGSRLRGSFQGDLHSMYKICNYDGTCTDLERWGTISGTFDVLIEDLSQTASIMMISPAGSYGRFIQ